MPHQENSENDPLAECFMKMQAKDPAFRRAAELAATPQTNVIEMKRGVLRLIAERRKTSPTLDALIRTVDACTSVEELQQLIDALRAYRKTVHNPHR